ncbi:hypothetical protein PS876_03923 [Pseudomonas fluorescens]|nr:hypothetical protein PS876_03923 [Pseudomonas fluorescens]
MSGLASSRASSLPQGIVLVLNCIFIPKTCESWSASERRDSVLRLPKFTVLQIER